jgi:uncharacterized protein
MIKRVLEDWLEKRLFKGKALLIFGARQTGKSTMVETLLAKQSVKWLSFNGDDADVREILSNISSTKLKALIGNHKLLLIDEAQRIENIGITLKIIVDQIKTVQVIATGSSSFELFSTVNESLTGRKFDFMLYPLSFEEMVNHHGLLEETRLIEHRMVYGYYPEIVTSYGEEKERLKLLANSYLYKDLLMLEKIKKPVVLEKLLKALALQVGGEVNLFELSQIVEVDRKTIEKYIDVLEKAFVIFQLPAFSRNLRNEIKKGRKIYFYDCGIRNAVIDDFNLLTNRNDVGALWENFIIAERIKFLKYQGLDCKFYFWRTFQQQEIDLIEEKSGTLEAYELKWGKKAKIPGTFKENYPNAATNIITKADIAAFVSKAEQV